MPPVKRRAKGAKAPPNRWTRGEIDVLLQCLGSDEFLSKHAKTLQTRQVPPFSLRDACVKENEYHGVCVALSQEILEQAGEHNNSNLRPFASIASKILDMTAKAKVSNPGLEAQALFDAFDVMPGILRWGGSRVPRPPSSAPLDPRGTRTPSVGACIGHMGLLWRWCPSEATNLGGRGRQIYRGHLDLSICGVASDEIVAKKKK